MGKRKHAASTPSPTKSKAATPAKSRPLSPGRVWLFRLVALMLPLCAMLLLELGLRLGGYGYPTGYFREIEIGSDRYFVNNEHFTLRFFPPELARWPTSFRFAAQKPPNTRRIFVFGESAAMGDPQPAYSASRYLEVLLRERLPGVKFEVINLGVTAINSHVILPMAQESADHHGDVWILYLGNNEMVGPFGAATVFGARAPPRALVRAYLAVQRTRTGQLLVSTLRKFGGKPANTTWGGMQMFMQNQIAAEDPRKQTVYRNFEANLRDIVACGFQGRASVLLNTVSVNHRDCPPFASLANNQLPAGDRERFQSLLKAGRNLQSQSNDLAAAEQFAEAAKLDAQFAEVHFRLAECLLRMTNPAAPAGFQLACDTDALPFRADTHINAAIRRVAKSQAGERLVLCDAEAALANAAPGGVAGAESFFEHVHFNPAGNYRLGRLWAEQVLQLLPTDAAATVAGQWASQEVCDRNLGLSIWNRGFVIESVLRRMRQPPLSTQFNNSSRLAALQAELKALQEQQAHSNAVMRTGQALVDAIQRAPQDSLLQEGFANFLEAVGDRRQAAGTYQKILDLLPHDFYAKLQLGRLYGELGRPAEGEPLLQQAARERATVADVWSELGDVQMALKKYAAALQSYTSGLKLRPQDPVFVCYQANALAKLDRRAEAIAGYRRAISLQAEIPEAHFELAGLLVAENQIAEALREYAEAIRLRPQHAVSRINLGVVLIRLNRQAEAIEQFQMALQLDPQNTAAADYLRQITGKHNPRQ